ncbi:MAG: hypothetical protein ACJ8M4_02305 [Chthoniobacterales bacterium]
MIRTIFSVLVLGSMTVAFTLKAEPSPTPKHTSANASKKASSNSVSANPKWSLVNGVWVHPDGYKFVAGQVVRTGSQTHKTPPKPPTKAEMEAAKRQLSPQSEADRAAAKAAERERNLTPRPAPQTGSHL